MQTCSDSSHHGCRHHLETANAFGDRHNPPILFLHGIRLGREVWAEQAEILARRYYVVALDLPGHGAVVDLPFTEENVRAAIAQTIGAMARPPLIVGYSLGGFVAMRHAARFPEQTAGLVLADCTLDFEGWRSWPYRAAVALADLLPDASLDALIHAALVVTLPSGVRRIVEEIPFNHDVFARTAALVGSSRQALREIATYRKPVLFVNGEFDLAFRLDEKRFLHRLPQARLRVIRGTDHTAPLRRAAEFAGIVDAFAGKVFGA